MGEVRPTAKPISCRVRRTVRGELDKWTKSESSDPRSITLNRRSASTAVCQWGPSCHWIAGKTSYIQLYPWSYAPRESCGHLAHYSSTVCGGSHAPTFTQNEVLRRACENRSATTETEKVSVASCPPNKSTGKSRSVLHGGNSTHMLLLRSKKEVFGRKVYKSSEMIFLSHG